MCPGEGSYDVMKRGLILSASFLVCFDRCVAIKIAVLVAVKDLCSLSSDSSCQLDVFGHNGDPLCVDGAEIGVFEEANQVSF